MAGVLSILNENTHDLYQLYNEKGVGSSHGWLIMVDDQTSSIFAVNALKPSMRIELPSLLFFPDGRKFDDDGNVHNVKNACVKKVVFSKNPTKEGCVAVAVFEELKKLGYCKVGDDKWTMMTDQQETVINAYRHVFDEEEDFSHLSAQDLLQLAEFCSTEY